MRSAPRGSSPDSRSGTAGFFSCTTCSTTSILTSIRGCIATPFGTTATTNSPTTTTASRPRSGTGCSAPICEASMKKHIAALALSTSILLAASAAEAKKVVVIRGIFGNIVSPMTEIVTGLQKRGHQVTVREWWMGVPEPGFDVAVVHSAGDVPGLMSRAKQVITIDPTFINPGCQPGSKCTNYYAPIDKMPFLVCCGGYAVAGA